jgi:hypothetical protein
MRLYHGTSAPGFRSFRPGAIYLTESPEEAAAYAVNDIIGGGRGEATRRVLAVEARRGETLDANAEVEEAIMEEDDFDTWINGFLDDARSAGYRYVTFYHPSAIADDEMLVTVSLLPDKDLRIVGEKVLR